MQDRQRELENDIWSYVPWNVIGIWQSPASLRNDGWSGSCWRQQHARRECVLIPGDLMRNYFK